MGETQRRQRKKKEATCDQEGSNQSKVECLGAPEELERDKNDSSLESSEIGFFRQTDFRILTSRTMREFVVLSHQL